MATAGERLERHANQLGALGHPLHLQIVRLVVQAGEEGVAAGTIQASVDIPASTLSFHLKRLAQAGLLAPRSEGTFLYYTADYAALRGVTEYLWEDCCKGGSPVKGCR